MNVILLRIQHQKKDILDNEIKDLILAAKYTIKSEFIVNTQFPNKETYLSKIKLDELKFLVEENDGEVLVVDDNLNPKQFQHLKQELDIDILDKPMLVLDIFSKNASSDEIKLQIELAQLKYNQPRLITQLGESVSTERQGLYGTGERITDTLSSNTKSRISTIEKKLSEIKRKKRVIKNDLIPKLPILGYYSVGKTTLFNVLTKSQRSTGQEAFTTMFLKFSRSKFLGFPIDLIDTVGLVDLPSDVINAFDLLFSDLFNYSGIIICLDSSLSIDDWKRQLKGIKDYVEKFNNSDSYDLLKMIIVLTKTDLITTSDLDDRKKVIYEDEWFIYYDFIVIEFSIFNENDFLNDFKATFEDLYQNDIIYFKYHNMSPSQLSSLYEVARIEEQVWLNNGRVNVEGVGLKQLINSLNLFKVDSL